MAQHLTEEEQIAQLKNWWQENGRAIVIGIVLAVGGYFGWQAWQSNQQQAREAASLLYEDLTQTVVVPAGESLSEQQREKAASLVEELKSEYGNLLYAADAALLMSRVAVEQGDLEQAQAHLQWLVDQNPSEELTLLARLRLAQVQYGQGDLAAALSSLQTDNVGAYDAAYAELRGDVLLAQGEHQAARDAYQSALETLSPEQASRRDIIQMKLDDIQLSQQSEAAAPAQGAES